jgi:hypothetical protein
MIGGQSDHESSAYAPSCQFMFLPQFQRFKEELMHGDAYLKASILLRSSNTLSRKLH